MEKVRFTNKYFYVGLIVLIVFILSWNIYLITNQRTFRLFFHISATLVILIFVIIKNKYTSVVLKSWSGLFLILSSALVIVGNLLKMIGAVMKGDTIEYNSIELIIWSLGMLSVGLLVFYGAKKFIETDKKNNEIEDHLIDKGHH